MADRENPEKFFVIIDGNHGLCLVDVAKSRVEYISGGDLNYLAQHLDMVGDGKDGRPPIDLDKMAVQLSGLYARDNATNLLETIGQLRAVAEVTARSSGGSDSLMVCLSGGSPMHVIAARGHRSRSGETEDPS